MSLNHFFYKQNRIQQLKGFYYTVRTGSVSNAAQKLNLTQAAITLQVKSLERDLGISLFNREGRKLKLTEAGKILYSQSSYYVQGIEDMFEGFIKFINDKDKNVIDIASNHATISYVLPKYIKAFKDSNQSTKFKIRNLSKKECVKRLLNDEIDMFIYPINKGEIPDELDFFPIVKYQPILLIRKDHPLSEKENITLPDVANFELIRIDSHLITLPSFEEIIKTHGLRSTIEFEMSDWEILKKFVKAGIGVAIISNIVLDGEDDSVLIGKNLTQYFPEMTYGVLIKKGKILSGVVKEFFNTLTNNSTQS